MKFYLLCFITVLSASLGAQEICDNGIDDDGDGLVDLQDEDCRCTAPVSGVPGDFEDFSCCPSNFTQEGATTGGFNCVNGTWNFLGAGTTDYYNTCGYLGGGALPQIPQPIPSGEGAVGFVTRSTRMEGISRCLECPMVAGNTYTYSFSSGFNTAMGNNQSVDVEWALYGRMDCDNLSAGNDDCPIGNGWTQLTTVNVAADPGNWVPVLDSFVATQSWTALAFAISCEFYDAVGSNQWYHYMDNLEVVGIFDGQMGCGVEFDASSELMGSCTEGYRLEVNAPEADQFQWYLDSIAIPGATTSSYVIDPFVPGNYSVRTIRADGACNTTSAISFEPDFNSLVIEADPLNPSCPGESNGRIDLDINSPNNPLTIDWNNGSNTRSITNLEEGLYVVTVTDDNGCFGELPVQLTDPDSILSTVVLDQGANDNQADVEINTVGGQMPYFHVWSNGFFGPDQEDLDPGTYMVTVSDANSCVEIITIEIFGVLSAEINVTPELCLGQCEGTANLIPSGGKAPYQFTWSVPGDAAAQNSLCPGSYSYTVTDDRGILVNGNFDINPGIEVNAVIQQDGLRCAETDVTTLDLSVSNGLGPYTFAWSNGETTEDLVGVGTGNYSVTATDQQGCETTASREVVAADEIQVTEVIEEATCQTPGSIALTVSGGEEPYAFTWASGQTTEDLDNIPAGDYFLTITGDNGCSIQRTYTVASPASIQAPANVVNTTCPGSATGSITVSATGSLPLEYAWATGETADELSGLTAGTYPLTITDNDGCSSVFIYEVMDPPLFTLDSLVSPNSCFGDSAASIQVTPQSPGDFTAIWSTGEAGLSITDLVAGEYEVTVTNAAGCDQVFGFVLQDEISPVMLALDGTDPICGFSNGSITSTASGGNDGFTYAWSNGATTQNLTDLGPGDYVLTVTDQEGCSTEMTTQLAPYPALQLMGEVEGFDCAGDDSGSIQLDPAGGTAPYRFEWSTGATTPNLENLVAGDYVITMIDALDCVLSDTFTLSEPAPLAVIEEVEPANCFGETGRITLTPSGGTAPYSISGEDGDAVFVLERPSGSFTYQIRDANDCPIDGSFDIAQPDSITVQLEETDPTCTFENGTVSASASGGAGGYVFAWSNGDTGTSIVDQAAGEYRVTITDLDGCTTESATTLEPYPALAIEGNLEGFDCAGDDSGSISVAPTGGTAPYSFAWESGETTPGLNDLGAGDYIVTITDALDCLLSDTFTLSEPPPLVVTREVEQPLCFGETGSVIVSASGGTGPYSISGEVGDTAFILNLAAGDYAFTVADANGCSEPGAFQIREPVELVASVTDTVPPVLGVDNGVITVTATGGTGLYTYEWSNGGSGPTQEGLAPGTYRVTITDENGCMTFAEASLAQPLPLGISLDKTDNICAGVCEASISLGAVGGTLPYTIQWSDGQTGDEAVALCDGVYQATLTDVNGNTLVSESVEIGSPAALTVADLTTGVTCVDAMDGRIAVQVAGGMRPYQYTWNGEQGDSTINQLAPGDYALSVTDANGCDLEDSFTVIDYEARTFAVDSAVVDCDFDAFALTVRGEGFTEVAWLINEEERGISAAGGLGEVNSGAFTVAYRENDQCVVEVASFLFDGEPPYVLSIDETRRELFFGDSISLELLSNPPSQVLTNGTVNWTSLDSFTCVQGMGENCASIGFSPSESQVVQVDYTDENGCRESFRIPLIVAEPEYLYIPTGFSPNRDGTNDVFTIFATEFVRSVKSVRLYNRWGSKVYDATGLGTGTIELWDGDFNGQAANLGLYVYTIEVELETGRDVLLKGEVMLLR